MPAESLSAGEWAEDIFGISLERRGCNSRQEKSNTSEMFSFATFLDFKQTDGGELEGV